MPRRILVANVALMWFCAVSANADEDSEYARSRNYVGLGGSYAVDLSIDDEVSSTLGALGYTGVAVDTQDSFGLDARVGYRFSPHMAAEVELEYFTSFDTVVHAPSISGKVLEYEIFAATANAKIPLLTGTIQPFLLGGAGVLLTHVDQALNVGIEGSELGLALRGGGGLDLYLSEHTALSFQASYLRPTGPVKDFKLFSLNFGIQYHF